MSQDVQKNTKSHRAKIIKNVIEWTLIVLSVCFIATIAIFASGKPSADNKAGSIFGYQTRLVVSSSMDADDSYYKDKNWKIKRIHTGSVVFLRSVNKLKVDDLHIDDVVCFTHPRYNVPTVHRIIDIKQNQSVPDGYVFTTIGDVARKDESGVIETFYWGNVLGKVTGTSKFIGDLYTNFFSKKWLVALVIIIPCLAIASYEIIKVVIIVKNDKEKTLKSSVEASDEKIRELQAELDDLKKKNEEEKK